MEHRQSGSANAPHEWINTSLDLGGLDFAQSPESRSAAVSRAFLTLIIVFVLLHLGLVALGGFNTGSGLFPASIGGCALLVAARWLIGIGRTRIGTWVGTGVPIAIALASGWFAAYIGVAQAAWIFIAVTYCTLVLGLRAGAVATFIALLAHAVLALAIESAQVQPRLVPHPFNQWLNLFTPCMVLLFSTGLLRRALLAAVDRQMDAAAVAAEEREQRLREAWSARTRLELAVQERTAALQKINEDLQALTYLLSHDIKGKVQVIGTFSQVTLERSARDLGDEGRRRLARVVANATELDGMIDGVLAYLRVSRLAPVWQHVDLDALLARIVNDVHEQFPGARVDAGGLGSITTDAVMLRHILLNLLGNGCKHAGREAALVSVRRVQRAGEDLFTVADNGPGLDREDAARIFELFQRGRSAGARAGHGVGLAIVKHLVEKLGGRIWVDSSTAAGARFHFTLARPPSASAETDAVQAEAG